MEYFLVDTAGSFDEFKKYKERNPNLILLNHYAYPGFDRSCYIFNDIKWDSEILNYAINFSTDWYYNNSLDDISEHEGFSWGPTIGCSLLLIFPYLLREYNCFKNLSLKYIWVATSETPEFIQLMLFLFGDKVVFYDSKGNAEKRLIDLYTKRIIHYPRSSFRYSFLKKLKYFLLKNKPISLFYTEGSLLSYALKKENIYLLNSKYFSKSIYINFDANDSSGKSFIPEWLCDANFYFKHFTNYAFINKKLNLDPSFLNLLALLVAQNLQAQKKALSSWLSFYSNLFKEYKISEMYFPGERVEFLSIGIEIAKIHKSKTIHITDGIIHSKKPFFFHSKKNKNSLFDSCIVFEKDSLAAIRKNIPIPCNVILEPELHPMLKSFSRDKSEHKKYDLIYFAPVSLEYNPNCLPDMAPVILDDLIKRLHTLKLRIAIKFKNVVLMNVFKKFFVDEIYKDIDLLICPPYEALKQTRAIITGVSTTISEAEVADVPSFVFEAKESGYTKNFLSEEFISKKILYTDMDTLFQDVSKFFNK